MATEIPGWTSSVEIFELFGQIFVYNNNFMSENFQKHLLKCWYCECYYNQNLALSNSPKLRGLLIAIFLYIPNVWKIDVTSLSDMVRIYSSPKIDSLLSPQVHLTTNIKVVGNGCGGGNYNDDSDNSYCSPKSLSRTNQIWTQFKFDVVNLNDLQEWLNLKRQNFSIFAMIVTYWCSSIRPSPSTSQT